MAGAFSELSKDQLNGDAGFPDNGFAKQNGGIHLDPGRHNGFSSSV